MALKIEDCAYRRPGVVPWTMVFDSHHTSLFFGDGGRYLATRHSDFGMRQSSGHSRSGGESKLLN